MPPENENEHSREPPVSSIPCTGESLPLHGEATQLAFSFDKPLLAVPEAVESAIVDSYNATLPPVYSPLLQRKAGAGKQFQVLPGLAVAKIADILDLNIATLSRALYHGSLKVSNIPLFNEAVKRVHGLDFDIQDTTLVGWIARHPVSEHKRQHASVMYDAVTYDNRYKAKMKKLAKASIKKTRKIRRRKRKI